MNKAFVVVIVQCGLVCQAVLEIFFPMQKQLCDRFCKDMNKASIQFKFLIYLDIFKIWLFIGRAKNGLQKF